MLATIVHARNIATPLRYYGTLIFSVRYCDACALHKIQMYSMVPVPAPIKQMRRYLKKKKIFEQTFHQI